MSLCEWCVKQLGQNLGLSRPQIRSEPLAFHRDRFALSSGRYPFEFWVKTVMCSISSDLVHRWTGKSFGYPAAKFRSFRTIVPLATWTLTPFIVLYNYCITSSTWTFHRHYWLSNLNKQSMCIDSSTHLPSIACLGYFFPKTTLFMLFFIIHSTYMLSPCYVKLIT